METISQKLLSRYESTYHSETICYGNHYSETVIQILINFITCKACVAYGTNLMTLHECIYYSETIVT
jgi:hypothetical protein